MDKINLIKVYCNAREKGFTEKNVKSAWRTTGNWPNSRVKALSYPEIQVDKEKRHVPKDNSNEDSNSDTINSGRDIINMAGLNATASERRKYRKIGIAYDEKQAELTISNKRILELEA